MTSDVALKKLVKLIEYKNKKACLEFFANMPENERRGFAKPVLKKLKKADAAWLSSHDRNSRRLLRNSISNERENVKVCVIATATQSELLKLGWRVIPDDGFIVDLMRAFKPAWLNNWANEILNNEPRLFVDIRLLYEAGLCEKPTGDGYTLGLILAVPGWWQSVGCLWDEKMPLTERIRTTPDIRDNDIWRLFEVEGGGDISLATFDKYIGGTKTGSWADALAQLGADGTLSRDRLLDASLSALERDFAQFRAGWFSRFHEHLKPTLEERVRRRDQYLRLLGSTIPPTVSFALKAIVLLDKANQLPPESLLAHVQPVLQARAKGTVTTALRLLGNAVKHSPQLACDAALLAADALIHDASDVQIKVLNLIQTLKGHEFDAVVTAMQSYADGVAPSLQELLAELIGDSVLAEPNKVENPAPATSQVVTVSPIESFDELNREFLRVIENPGKPLDVERVLDGLARHGANKPKNFDKLIGPLKKRASAIIKLQPFDELQDQMARLAVAYAVGEEIDLNANTEDSPTLTFKSVFIYRSHQLLSQVERDHALPLLSLPSDSRGYVAADSLIARYNEYKANKVTPGQIDMSLALMRLSPECRESALHSLQLDTEFDHAIGYALGAEITIGETAWLWVAAAAARLPYENQPAIAKKHGLGNPDAGATACYSIRFSTHYNFVHLTIAVTPQVNTPFPVTYLPSLLHIDTASDGTYHAALGCHVNLVRWCSTIWPLNNEPFFANGVVFFQHNERVANSPYVAFFEPMLDAHVAIGPMGCVMLAVGLVSIDPAVKSIAVDAAITCIEQNRLDLETMRFTMATLLPSGFAPVGRWTKSFAEVGAVSKTHMIFVRDVIAGALRHEPAEAPRDIGGLIELLYEYSVATKKPINDPKTIAYLQDIIGGGKLKKFATKLLAQGKSE